ncbi:hypothetical protein [Sphingomonas sp. DT-204]|uniref:hypothetical protein n=1 Tax=Sphingomonas sp. DT-204 TaxID=3396166 RepID=UPI003F1D17D1
MPFLVAYDNDDASAGLAWMTRLAYMDDMRRPLALTETTATPALRGDFGSGTQR